MINLSNKTNNIPLITIGITCFNASDTIERALKSAFSQDWENYEVIVIDDCSTDGTRELIQKEILCHLNFRQLTLEVINGHGTRVFSMSG